ncbi:hypothetical protein ADK70_26665 [Streptomyces rimosus subsp. pseudoverticillatus]|uniref:DUF4259 domain-containing protein n=1 Tax=Streptomyces rimosus TaxID=1927 RepID=UPI0006B27BFE|nr:DUF4259 domain-containing protein [Streptomyces rimosus]KOT81122.1 hypothetical protein ADK70_26665 [Streptomyces rimosus subsp. pseudoverticillatus]
MGTWDMGPFGNDGAADLLDDLGAMPVERRLGAIRGVLSTAAAERDYLEAPEGEMAVAAAALIAAARAGSAFPADPVYAPDLTVPEPPRRLAVLAVHALDRVLAPDSELAELWDESDGGQEWLAHLARLRAELTGDTEPAGGTD